jgi:hypothetical protein
VDSAERTDDPVRMYLRDMGSVELLSRQGEVAVAKRIEAGREIMLAGLCESPLTFQAITIWGDELKAGKIYLRDIMDLDATHAGSDAEGIPAPVIGPDDAITFHEAAHGFVAHLLGDDTAWRLGRVSFNPVKHIDPFGTILLPGMLLLFHAPFLFGYAKPVPVNFQALRSPRRDMVLVAAAGPVMNIALAVVAALAFHMSAIFQTPALSGWRIT